MKTLAYVRDSSGDESAEAQRHIIAQTHNVDAWFADEAPSEPNKGLKQPGISELIRSAQKGDLMIVSSIDRLGRSNIELLEAFQTFNAKGVRVISIRERFDLFSPIGKETLAMVSDLADVEHTLAE